MIVETIRYLSGKSRKFPMSDLFLSRTWSRAGLIVALIVTAAGGVAQDDESRKIFNAQLQRVLSGEDSSGEHLAVVLTHVRSPQLAAFLEQQRKVNALQADRLRSVHELLEMEHMEYESVAVTMLLADDMKLLEDLNGTGMGDHAVIVGARTMMHLQLSGYKNLMMLAQMLPDASRISELLRECQQDESDAISELDRLMREVVLAESEGDPVEDPARKEEEGR